MGVAGDVLSSHIMAKSMAGGRADGTGVGLDQNGVSESGAYYEEEMWEPYPPSKQNSELYPDLKR